MASDWNLESIRSRFPALSRRLHGQPVVYFDGPAGSQVPKSVAEAVSHYLLHTNSNRGAASATAVESDNLLESAHQTFADFLGAPHPESIYFGSNMTSMTFACSRALASEWKSGDEILVSRLDHDANVSPWVLAARDKGVTVRHIELHHEDWTLNLDDFRAKLSERTKLVAVGYASNATGTINPVAEISRSAREAGALTFVDAVHYAPHGRINVEELQCDFLACSAYKFFGPHIGIMYGRRDLLDSVRPYKLRPSTDALPGKWMTGTQCHEGIAGAAAAVNYLAELADTHGYADESESTGSGRRGRLDRAFENITLHEQRLSRRFLEGLLRFDELTLHGIADISRISERAPTFSMTHNRHTPQELASKLAEQGVYAWAGNHYALPFTQTAGLEPHGTLRFGALHYNSLDEVDRTIDCLSHLV